MGFRAIYGGAPAGLSGSAVFPVISYMRLPRSSFEILVRSHSRELYVYAYGLCRDSHMAEDLVQETLLRAWRHLDSLRDPKALRAWLYTIVRREHARLYRRSFLDTGMLDDLEPEVPPSYDTSAVSYGLRQALPSLPECYREPLLLQVLGGFSCSEIGEIMDLTPGTVMTRVSRARRKLRELLMPEYGPGKRRGGRQKQ